MSRAWTIAVTAAGVALFLSACQTPPSDYAVGTAGAAIAIAIKHCAIDANDANEQASANWTAGLAGGVWSVAYSAPPQAPSATIQIGTISTTVAARDGAASACTAEMLVGGR